MAREDRIPYWIVIGDKEIESQKFVTEHRSGTKSEPNSIENIINNIHQEIVEKLIK